MKKFAFNILVFIIPVLCWFTIEGLLPTNTFTIRPWESLDFQTRFDLGRNFYPNNKLQMESVGELAHHTKYAIHINETWITDKFGNRNDSFIEDPDILLIGDSNVVCEGVTQDSTFSNQLKSELGNQFKVYNIASSPFAIIDYYLKVKFIKKPQMIIYIRSERYVPRPLLEYSETNSLKSELKTTLINNSTFSDLCIFMDKSLRQYSIKWLKARILDKKGLGKPGIKGSNMWFLDTEYLKNEKHLVYELNDVYKISDNILSYKDYCDSLNIEFIYVPIANKSSVYYDFVPLEQQPDDHLFLLDSILVANNVNTVNTLKLFNVYRERNTDLLYQLDDPHMNSNGINIVSRELAKIIKANSQLHSERNNLSSK